ncbi:MAG: hypothetical protein AAB405_00220 [Patescibacteria group bacterium]
MVGHQNKIEIFKKLADKDKLFHAYLFFGESQVGKFLFTVSMANYLECGIFEEPRKILEEALIIAPDIKNKIGIESARKLRDFLFQSPILSKKRIVIIRDAENLTFEAQNALLKIVEDNPPFSLIIFISSDENSLLPALSSRLQKIYFSRVAEFEIKKYLENMGVKKEDKKKIAEAVKNSFGRPGMAIDMIQNQKPKTKNFKIDDVVENEKINEFFENKLIELRDSGYKDIDSAKEILKRLSLIKMFNVNKKLQLKTLLNN